MDKDNTIDITHMTKEERAEHYRKLTKEWECPCLNCITNRFDCDTYECEPHKKWVEKMFPFKGRKQ